MTRTALKPHRFPWFDYSRYTFSLGLQVGSRTLLSGHTASEYDVGSRTMVVRGGMAEQARTAWDKIAAILEAGGRGLADVVRVVEYVTVAGLEQYAEAAAVRAERLGSTRPAVNTVVVSALLRPRALIEIEVTAGPAEPPCLAGDAPPAWAPARAADGLVYLSSLLPVDDRGRVTGEGDVVAQVRAIYAQAARILGALGLGLDRIVKTVDYLTRPALPAYRATGAVRREQLGPVYPAAAGIVVGRLPHPDALIQVDLIAARQPPAAVNPGWARYGRLTYNPAVRAGDVLLLSGFAALDPETERAVHAGDVAAQAAHVYETIRQVLAAAGARPEHLVKTVEYVTPAGLPRYREVAGVRARYLSVPFPASTGCVCEALLRPEFEIEVDALAIVG